MSCKRVDLRHTQGNLRLLSWALKACDERLRRPSIKTIKNDRVSIDIRDAALAINKRQNWDATSNLH